MMNLDADPVGIGDPALDPPEVRAAISQQLQTDRSPILVRMSDVQPTVIEWLWKDRLPIGRLTILAGKPGCGKSLLSLDAAARVSQGRDWPDGTPCPHGSVLMLAAEDGLSDTVRPRLDAARADVTRVVVLKGQHTLAKDGSKTNRGVTLEDLDVLEAALDQMPDCKLVTVDPVGSYLGRGTDAHRDNEVRAVLSPLAALAEKRNIAVLVVCHTRKGTGGSADDMVLGSSAGFVGIARSVLHTLFDPNDKYRNRRFLLPGKCNIAKATHGWSFTLADDALGNPYVVWGDRITDHIDDILDAMSKPGPEADQLLLAVDWLNTALADGPRQAADLNDEASNGAGISKRTLDRARKVIGVKAERPVNPGPWLWSLPKEHIANGEHIAKA